MEECEQQLKGSDALFFLAKVWIQIQPLMFRQFLLQVGDKCHHSYCHVTFTFCENALVLDIQVSFFWEAWIKWKLFGNHSVGFFCLNCSENLHSTVFRGRMSAREEKKGSGCWVCIFISSFCRWCQFSFTLLPGVNLKSWRCTGEDSENLLMWLPSIKLLWDYLNGSM